MQINTPQQQKESQKLQENYFKGRFSMETFDITKNAYCFSSANVMVDVFKQAWSMRLNICGSQKRRLNR